MSATTSITAPDAASEAARRGRPPRYVVDQIPQELRDLDRWCVFQVVKEPGGKTKKLPFIAGLPGRNLARCDDPSTLRPFAKALRDAEVRGFYLAFAFDVNLPYFFLDADDVILPNGTVCPEMALLRDALDTYTEVSASGTGLHIIGRGAFPERCATPALPDGCGTLELYPKHGARFCLFTGNTLPGLETIEARQDVLDRIFPARPAQSPPHAASGAGVPGPRGILTDDETAAIIASARPFWTDGRRHAMALHLSGYLGKQGVAREQALAIIDACASDDSDPGAKLAACHATYDALEAGETVSGWQGLTDICGLTEADLAPLAAVLDRFWQRCRPTFRHKSEEPLAQPWPVLDPAALHGLPGDIVRALEPHTEADPVGILANVLVQAGAATGRSPHTRVGATRHGVNLFAVTCGQSARARKGTAGNEVRRIIDLADPDFRARIMGGLSSGEGLIYAVRDPAWQPDKKTGDMKRVDAGVDDKRLLVVEPEFSSPLRVMSREGNTLSEQVRRGYDGDDLRNMTKNSPLAATSPHIAMIGHITQPELVRELSETNQLNGFANRFLFVAVRRTKLLPDGGALDDGAVQDLARKMERALQAARRRGELRRDPEAREMWHAVYPALTADRPGMFGAITARAEAHVLRLSLLYALLDDAPAIQRPHLEAALAVWKYAEDSARFIFGDATGDPVADRVLSALRGTGPMSQNEIVDLFGRHVRSDALGRALEALLNAGRIVSERIETGGRPRTVWKVTS